MKPRLFYSSTERYDKGSFIDPVIYRTMLTDGKPLVAAQDDETLTRAFALLNQNKDGGIAIGTITVPGYEPYIYMIARDGAVITGQSAGYIHEVETRHFELRSDNIGQKKWMSAQPVKVVADPVVITPEEVMKKIQIYFVSDPALIQELKENRPKHLDILTREMSRSLADRRIEWLNQTLGINPIRLPDDQSRRNPLLDLRR